MEQILNCASLFQLGGIRKKCLHLVPSGRRIICCDSTGNLSLYRIKSNNLTKKTIKDQFFQVNSVIQHNERIYVSDSGGISFLSESGQLLTKINLSVEEHVITLIPFQLEILIFTERECYLCSDEFCELYCRLGHSINDCVGVLENSTIFFFTAGSDRRIKAFSNDESVDEMEQPDFPTALSINLHNEFLVVFGTDSGRLGAIQFKNNKMRLKWEFSSHSGTINCIVSTADKIISGSDSGKISVLSYSSTGVTDCLGTANLRSSITCLLLLEDETIVLCSTVAGSVSEVLLGNESTPSLVLKGGDKKFPPQGLDEADFNSRREETAKMYDKKSREEGVVVFPEIEIQNKMTWNNESKCHIIELISSMATDYLILSGTIGMQVIDKDMNVEVKKYKNEHFKHLVSIKFNTLSCRLSIKVKFVEGHTGHVDLLVFYADLMTAKKVTFEVKPLSHHQRVSEPGNIKNMNVLKFSGLFSAAECNSWIFDCFPEVPEIISSSAITYYFKSVLLGTAVCCKFGDGELVLEAENISSLAILHEFISMKAIKEKVKLKSIFVVNHHSFCKILRILVDQVLSLRRLEEEYHLLVVLRDVMLEEGEDDNFVVAHKRIIKKEESLTWRYSTLKNDLNVLSGVICDYYVDWFKFNSRNVEENVGNVRKSVLSYSVEDLCAQFETKFETIFGQSLDGYYAEVI